MLNQGAGFLRGFMRSISCPKCQASNQVSNRCCRQCGAALPDDLIAAAQLENQKLVADGQKLFGEGRIDEALMIANAVLELDAECIPALSLLGDCYERQGKLPEALETYELIVSLRPDSPLDRIRVAHLRKLSMSQELELVEPQARRQTFFAAVAAGVLLICAASAIVLATSPAAADDKLVMNAPVEESGIEPFRMAPVPTASQANPTATNPTTDPNQPTVTNPPVTNNAPQPPAGYFPENTRRWANGLPDQHGRGSGPAEGEVPPFDPGVPTLERDPHATTGGGTGTSTGTTGNGSTGTTGGTTNGGSTGTGGTGTGDPDPVGIIDIRPSTKTGGSTGIPEAGNDIKQAETLIRVARDAYATGNYTRAADLYEKALKAGASKASTNQRLAQCYEKLKRKTDAIAAYQRAIQAYEAKIKAGTGTARDQAAADACRQAIRLLGG